jgi:hypothetical protein
MTEFMQAYPAMHWQPVCGDIALRIDNTDAAGKADLSAAACNNAGSGKKKTGAGEGIRTLDPDLGKVVLYP